MDAKILTEVIAAITERTISTEHSHMLKPWEMVFGGLVLPMLADLDESVKSDPNFLEMQARYSKEEVEKFFTPKTVDKIKVEKIETIKVIEKIVGGAGMTRMPTLHQTVEVGGKFRRLKTTVAKVARKVNDIPPEGRDAINKWWNANQRLTTSGDCQPIADEINSWGICSMLSAAQVSGWLSWLCRLALKTSTDRNDYLRRAVHIHRKFNVVPVFTDSLCNDIANNKLVKAEDRRLAAVAKARMKAECAEAMKSGTVTA